MAAASATAAERVFACIGVSSILLCQLPAVAGANKATAIGQSATARVSGRTARSMGSHTARPAKTIRARPRAIDVPFAYLCHICGQKACRRRVDAVNPYTDE